ncbi:MAG: hypothetical protein FWG93_02945, partial [Oscillospiraceae bacterium]|nr:hypothetical protein [Oscillospiraceae bacterium]
MAPQSLQQLNQEFLRGSAPLEPAAQPAVIPDAAAEEKRPNAPSLGKDILFLLLKIASIALVFVLMFTFL